MNNEYIPGGHLFVYDNSFQFVISDFTQPLFFKSVLLKKFFLINRLNCFYENIFKKELSLFLKYTLLIF